MSLIQFLKSKVFFKQLAIAVGVTIILGYLIWHWLGITTKHGQFQTVPDLTGKSVEVAKIELQDNDLVLFIQDSANFNPNYPRYSVIEQDPLPGSQVKENRKIYITLNPSGFKKVAVPDLRGKTFRQAKPTLEALGFKLGDITYVDYLAENEVVEMLYKGVKLEKRDSLAKTSTIDIVLGNGVKQ